MDDEPLKLVFCIITDENEKYIFFTENNKKALLRLVLTVYNYAQDPTLSLTVKQANMLLDKIELETTINFGNLDDDYV